MYVITQDKSLQEKIVQKSGWYRGLYSSLVEVLRGTFFADGISQAGMLAFQFCAACECEKHESLESEAVQACERNQKRRYGK